MGARGSGAVTGGGAEIDAAIARRTRVLLVSGMSGAGKSSALKVLEDLDYEAVDNLPLSLLDRLAGAEPPGEAETVPSDEAGRRRLRALAVGIDARTRDFAPDLFIARLRALKERADLETSFLFLECEDGVLHNRFTTTRRRHPLAADRPVIDGIHHERQLLYRVREQADLVLDTTEMALPELRRLLGGHYALDRVPGLTITVTSFSYRRGLPREADLVFDMRFLRNPYYVPALRPLTGEDAAVAAYVAEDPACEPFFGRLCAMLVALLPPYSSGGKNYLTIALGCTGGRHRSVFAARTLANRLQAEGFASLLRHRDIGDGGE